MSTVEEGEFDDEIDFDHGSTELLDEIGGGLGGAAGGEEVVDDDDTVTGCEGVAMDFEGGGAVFEVVGGFDGLVGEFSFFTNGNEGNAEEGGDGGAEDEAPGFDGGDGGEVVVAMALGEEGEGALKEFGIFEDRGDVFEQDPRLGEVGDVADGGFEILFDHAGCSSR